MDLIIGSHVSFKKDKQLLGSVLETVSYGGNAFMFYTGAPQNTLREDIDINLTNEAYALMKKNNIDIENVIVHAPYIINLANAETKDFSISFLKQEIGRCEQLGVSKIVLHPGSHVGQGIETGLKNIIDALNEIINPEQNVSICLEVMAGKGSECGSTFEELKYIIDGVNDNSKLLVCLDTCHLNDAGFDLKDFDNLLEYFNNIIGLNKLGCIHLNDSKNECGSKKDRHENIGFGKIGFDSLLHIVYHECLLTVPKILETPYVTDFDNPDEKYPPYKWEIEMIKRKSFDENVINNIRSFH
ncbi:MAG: deoxyribonuclease IV [Bacilli bacterium]